jgi:hypothetical protein
MNSGMVTLVPTSLIPYLDRVIQALNYTLINNYTPKQSALPDIGSDFYSLILLQSQ